MSKIFVDTNAGENHLLSIDEVYVFISKDEKGNEGVIGQKIGDSWMPFVAADKARLDALILMARELAKHTNKKIKLIKLTKREDIKEWL